MERTANLYAAWYRKSIDGLFADCVLIAGSDDAPAGFVTCKLEDDVSRGIGRSVAAIGICAVAQDHEGRGAPAAMFNAVVQWCARRDVHRLRSRILINNLGCAYSALRTGALPVASFHTFHKWAGEHSSAAA